MSPSTSVLETLLKTNRPPTDEERAIILESMAPTNAKLKAVDTRITEQMAYIQELELQVEQAENKLHRLWEEEAAILDTFADHDRVFAPFRKLPDDILREICVACVQDEIPELCHDRNTMPYILSQICSGMRRVALTTPFIWASMRVVTTQIYSTLSRSHPEIHAILAQIAIEWFERAGGLALTIIIEDMYTLFDGTKSDPASILFDVLLSYSTRWKEIQFTSYCRVLPTPMIRIASLTAADVPVLQTVSLCCPDSISSLVNSGSELLTTPTLRHLTLTNTARIFAVNWAVLISVTLHGETKNQIGIVLQQTRCLEFCNINVYSLDKDDTDTISLPFLKTFIVQEECRHRDSPGDHSILRRISAPILERLETRVGFLDLSLSEFLSRSPHITKLLLLHFNIDQSFMETMEILRHCPSLVILSLQAHMCHGVHDADRFLRAFVETGPNGVICPRLQDFSLCGQVDFPVKTLQIFLEGKQGGITTRNFLPWTRVRIVGYEINSAERRQQVSDLVSQKQAAGLDVGVYTVGCAYED